MLNHAGVVLVLGVLTIAGAQADDDIDKSAQLFRSYCLENGSDFDRLRSRAAILKWTPVPDESRKFPEGQEPEAFDAWYALGAQAPVSTTVAALRHTLDGKPVQSCMITIVNVAPTQLEERVRDAAELEELDVKHISGLRFGTYSTNLGGTQQTVVIGTAVSQDGVGWVSLESRTERR